MLKKIVIHYKPLLQESLCKISTSNVKTSRVKHRQNPFSSVLKDDMYNMTPKEIHDEITFMSDMPLKGIMERQDLAERDIQLKMKRMRFKNIERKYFRKEPEPCFLTHSMKEQIRNLHMLDPHLWIPQNLSYVFPATLHEIKNLIYDKSPKLSEEKQKAHDDIVLKNWKKYTKGQLGSTALLKKTIENRFTEVSKTNLPSPTMANNQDVSSFLASLKFTGEDDEIAFHDEKSKKHIKKILKQRYPFKGTFKEIITNYDADLESIKRIESGITEEHGENELVECKNLGEILPERKRDPTEVFIQVNPANNDPPNAIYAVNQSHSKEEKPGRKNITYENFIKSKSSCANDSDNIFELLKKEEHEQALALLQKVLSVYPKHSTAINLLLLKLSKSGDHSNIEYVGNYLCDKLKSESEFLSKLAFAYQVSGKTEIFLNRVLNHYVECRKDNLISIIPFSAILDILIKEPQFELLVQNCSKAAAKVGDTRMMGGLLNAYLILKNFKAADEIYDIYFKTEKLFYIKGICSYAYSRKDCDHLYSILEIANRHPEGRENLKGTIYSTIIDLLTKENKLDAAIEAVENLSLQNLAFEHIRKGTLKQLKYKIEKSGKQVPFEVN